MTESTTSNPERILVVGASRGIGAGFVAALQKRSSVRQIFCAARSIDATSDSASDGAELIPLRLDLTDEASVHDAAEQIRQKTDRLDWVINTVGLLHDGDQMQPERRLSDIDPGNIQRSFAVNSIGPVLLAKHLAALLPTREPALFASLSARVGSISDNRLGGWYAYRAAKAAQNMLLKTLSIELKRRHRRIRVVALHPGTVATDLSAPFQGNVSEEQLFSVAQSVNYLLAVLDQLSDDDNGKFLAWDGQTIDW